MDVKTKTSEETERYFSALRAKLAEELAGINLLLVRAGGTEVDCRSKLSGELERILLSKVGEAPVWVPYKKKIYSLKGGVLISTGAWISQVSFGETSSGDGMTQREVCSSTLKCAPGGEALLAEWQEERLIGKMPTEVEFLFDGKVCEPSRM